MINRKNLLKLLKGIFLEKQELKLMHKEMSLLFESQQRSLSLISSSYHKSFEYSQETLMFLMLSVLHRLRADYGLYENHFTLMDLRNPSNYHYNIWIPMIQDWRLNSDNMRSYMVSQMSKSIKQSDFYHIYDLNSKEQTLEYMVDQLNSGEIQNPYERPEVYADSDYFNNPENWNDSYIEHELSFKFADLCGCFTPHDMYYALSQGVSWFNFNELKKLLTLKGVVNQKEMSADFESVAEYILSGSYLEDKIDVREHLVVWFTYFIYKKDLIGIYKLLEFFNFKTWTGKKNFIEQPYSLAFLYSKLNESFGNKFSFSFEHLFYQIYTNTYTFEEMIDSFKFENFVNILVEAIAKFDSLNKTSKIVLSNGHEFNLDWYLETQDPND